MPAVVLLLASCASGATPSVPVATTTPAAGKSPTGSGTPSAGDMASGNRTSSPVSTLSDAERAALQNMPVGDLPGWKQVFTEDFTKGDVPLGAFPGPAYAADWSAGYKDGTPDTAGQISRGKSGYYPSKVLSVANGVLDWFVHSENGVFMGAAPTPKFPNASTAPPRSNSMLYGRVSVRFRADSLAGYKIAWLFWPDSGVWPRDGEIDFPEVDTADIIYGAAHWANLNPSAADVYSSGARLTSWHVATTEWSPGQVKFLLDGQQLGVSTTLVPAAPMHYILQTEACLPTCPSPQTQRHVYLDWIAIWSHE